MRLSLSRHASSESESRGIQSRGHLPKEVAAPPVQGMRMLLSFQMSEYLYIEDEQLVAYLSVYAKDQMSIHRWSPSGESLGGSLHIHTHSTSTLTHDS
jgi:hypothetical protein